MLAHPPLQSSLYHLPLATLSWAIAVARAMNWRPDEVIENTLTACIWSPAIRNGLHAFLAPTLGLAGPNLDALSAARPWRALTSTRRKAMDSHLQWRRTFGLPALSPCFTPPLVSFFFHPFITDRPVTDTDSYRLYLPDGRTLAAHNNSGTRHRGPWAWYWHLSMAQAWGLAAGAVCTC